MRVAVDARAAVAPQPTGIGLYVRELLRLLPRVDPGSIYTAWYLNARGLAGGRRHLLRDVVAAPTLRERETRIPARWFARLEARFDAPRLEWLTRFDVLFAPNFVPPPTRSRHVVVTVHDLAFRRYPETAPHSTRWWLERLDRTLPRAARVIVPSEATRADLLEMYGVDPARIEVIPHGVDTAMFRPSTAEQVSGVRRRFGIDGPYVLALGGIEPRKNLPRLIEGWAGVPDHLRPTLVVAGGSVAWNPEGEALLTGALDRLPASMRARVILTGYVEGEDRVALIGGAEALVYPSLYEGFGLPVLEAMACGTPVLTSDRSSLPEVGGDAALLVDPEDPAAIGAGIERIVQDRQYGDELRARGRERVTRFDWETTARRTAEAIREAAR